MSPDNLARILHLRSLSVPFRLSGNIENRPVVVVGAGTLGRRIALMLATASTEVRVVDTSKPALDQAETYIKAELPRLIQPQRSQLAALTFTQDLSGALGRAWLVTEAVAEKLELKRVIFGDLDRLAPSDAILASNSSSFPTSQMLDRVTRPERVVNTHYYMPPQVNAVEIMSCGHTHPDVIERLLQHLPACGLLPFHVQRESVGFIFNRIWAAIKRESLTVVAEGIASPKDVDRMFSAIMGIPAGPFRLMDRVGLDVVLDIEEHYAAAYPDLPISPRHLLRQYVDRNQLGVKTRRGFYDYSDD